MKIDVLIEYDAKLSEVTFSSKATQFSETRTARIGLSRMKHEDISSEQVEFVGEDWETIKQIEDEFPTEPTRKNHILRIINPFEPKTFEPTGAFRMINHFSRYILATYYPKTWTLRTMIPLMNKYEIVLKIPNYEFFNPHKKAEFEKLLRKEYRHITFVS